VKRPFAILATALLVVGCSNDYHYGVAYVDSLAVRSVSPRGVSFLVFGAFPTPCWEYTGFTTEGVPWSPPGPEKTTVRVALHGRIEAGIACTDVIAPFAHGVDIALPGPGVYEFQFDSGGSSSVDTVLAIQ
jgi:hypothetical protein